MLDLGTGVLLRLGEDLAVVSSASMPQPLAPSSLTPSSVLHLLSFGQTGVWLLDPGFRRIWRFKDGAWDDPLEVEYPFANGSAVSGGAVVLNVP
ncbi:MAG: hypothetical protein ACE5ID_08920, partial [Acidobacteriota bacterium]